MLWVGRVLIVVAVSAGSLGAQEPSTATAPATDPALAGQFLAAAREALRKGDNEAALEALRQATARDPGLVEGHYRLGRLFQLEGRTRDAIQHYQRVLELVGSARGSPDAAKWKADAERAITRLSVYPKQWQAMREDYARRFRDLSAGQGGTPSCVRTLEVALALTPEEATVKTELVTARGLLPKGLPAPAGKPDPKGARLLAERAAEMVRLGKPDQGVPLLRNACGMARDPHLATALAEALLSAGRAPEAAVIAEEARRLIEQQADDAVQRALEGRLLALRRKADPSATKVDALLDQFAGRAEGLAANALNAKDADTAEEILSLVLDLLPARERAQQMLDRLSGLGPTCRRIPNLSSEGVRCAPLGSVRAFRTARTLEVYGLASKDLGGGAVTGAQLQFLPLLWGTRLRTVWRVQQLKPAPKDLKEGTLRLGCWPISGYADIHVYYPARTWFIHTGMDSRAYRVEPVTDAEGLKRLFRDDGTYEVCFEKAGEVVTASVGGTVLVRFTLTPQQQRDAVKARVAFIIQGNLREGEESHLKATLLEFECSADCIKPE